MLVIVVVVVVVVVLVVVVVVVLVAVVVVLLVVVLVVVVVIVVVVLVIVVVIVVVLILVIVLVVVVVVMNVVAVTQLCLYYHFICVCCRSVLPGFGDIFQQTVPTTRSSSPVHGLVVPPGDGRRVHHACGRSHTVSSQPEGLRKEGHVLFNDAPNTFYLRLYGVRHNGKEKSDSERGNPLPPHGLLFLISRKGSFTCIIPQTG